MSVETFNYVLPELPNLWAWLPLPAATLIGSVAIVSLTQKEERTNGLFINYFGAAGVVLSVWGASIGCILAGNTAVDIERDAVKEFISAETTLDTEEVDALWEHKETVEDGHKYKLVISEAGDDYTVIVTGLEETE